MRLSSLVAELVTQAFKQKVRCKSWFPRRITSVIASRLDVSVVEKGHVVVFKYRTMSVSSTKDGIVDKIALMLEAVRTSEMSVYFNKTTRRYIPDGCYLHTRRRENMNSHSLRTDPSQCEYLPLPRGPEGWNRLGSETSDGPV
jgi:hypothetical protein